MPQVGLFFVTSGKPLVHGAPWTEVASQAGFRTHLLGHPDVWSRLQEHGAVRRGMDYEECPPWAGELRRRQRRIHAVRRPLPRLHAKARQEAGRGGLGLLRANGRSVRNPSG